MDGSRTVAVLALAASALAQQPEIHWEKDLATARAAARADGRPVIAYFTFET